VIIPARDAAPTLDRTLDALRGQSLEESFEVIVVDDGSRDATSEIARRYDGFVRLIRNPESRGPGAARNRGVEVARASVLAFTDADCFPTPEWLAGGLRALRENGLVQGRVAPDPAARRTPFDRSLEVDGDGGFYQTANLFVGRETFDAAGGFIDWVLERRSSRRWSPDRRRHRGSRTPIGEDTLFAWTARRLGIRSAFAPEALVYHAVVPGGLMDALADRWHWSRDMPGLVALVPELRRTTCYRQVFFNHVSARFDLALAGALASAVGGRGRRRSLIAAVPYIRHVLGYSEQWAARERAIYVLAAPVMDGVTLAGLLAGSALWRSLVL
jgi:glycosyltransferase involved in cell wall biosynthesis